MTTKYYLVEVIRKMCDSERYYIEADDPDQATKSACDREWEPVFGPWTEEEYEVKEVSIEEWKEGNNMKK